MRRQFDQSVTPMRGVISDNLSKGVIYLSESDVTCVFF